MNLEGKCEMHQKPCTTSERATKYKIPYKKVKVNYQDTCTVNDSFPSYKSVQCIKKMFPESAPVDVLTYT